jgi:hypothetical protein
MEHMVRVQNEADRQILTWLRERVGEVALARTVRDGAGRCGAGQAVPLTGLPPAGPAHPVDVTEAGGSGRCKPGRRRAPPGRTRTVLGH